MATKVESYMLNPYGGVTRIWDGAAIPDDAGNTDWQRYLAWVAEGNTAEPFSGAVMASGPPPPPPPEPEALRWQLDQQLIIERLDAAHYLEPFIAVLDDGTLLTRELWRARYRVWNDDPFVVGLVQQAGANPLDILAKP